MNTTHFTDAKVVDTAKKIRKVSGGIVGCVVAAVIVLLAIIAAVIIRHRRRKRVVKLLDTVSLSEPSARDISRHERTVIKATYKITAAKRLLQKLTE